MFGRLLIALPIAAAVVLALFLAMRSFVPVGRAQADHTIRITLRSVDASIPEDEPRIIIEDPPPPERPPLPKPVPPEPSETQPMPRERFPPPERTSPDDFPQTSGSLVNDRCKDGRPWSPSTCCSLSFPKHARDGDYAIVEFDIGPDGMPKDFRVVGTSNPKIIEDVLRIARIRLREGWRYKTCVEGKAAETTGLRTRIEFFYEKENVENRQ